MDPIKDKVNERVWQAWLDANRQVANSKIATPRERNVAGEGKDVYRRGTGLGGAPVGQPDVKPLEVTRLKARDGNLQK